MNNLAINYFLSLIGFLVFGYLHSIFASLQFKQRVFNAIPTLKTSYRFLYSLLSVIYLGIWYFTLPQDFRFFWAFENELYWLFRIMQVFSLLGLAYAVFISSPFSFIGIKQLFQSGSNASISESFGEQLKISSLYRYSRHPMYLFSILFLITEPIMTYKHAFLSSLFIIYFYIGSYYEEKNLERKFGSAYRDYKKTVPRIFPFLK